LEELQLFPETTQALMDVIFFNFGDAEMAVAQSLILQLRKKGISADFYPDNAKLKKQFDYAAKRGARYVAFLGEKEISAKEVIIKNQETGTQQNIPFSKLSDFFTAN
jgi:histidyl-tRNA synthetase